MNCTRFRKKRTTKKKVNEKNKNGNKFKLITSNLLLFNHFSFSFIFSILFSSSMMRCNDESNWINLDVFKNFRYNSIISFLVYTILFFSNNISFSSASLVLHTLLFLLLVGKEEKKSKWKRLKRMNRLSQKCLCLYLFILMVFHFRLRLMAYEP